MGKFLGSYDGEEIERPDLNKCPDCGCFFASDNCPLCGKTCPEEFRAGNRKAPKKKKSRGNSSSRTVTFIDWYHSWWVIILALIFFPIVGIILLITSPHKKSIKITVVTVGVLWTVLSYVGIGNIINGFSNIMDKPVDTSLTREEYIAACETVTPEDFYRSADDYTKDFVSVTLTVSAQITDVDGYYSNNKYTTYYVCTDSENSKFEILIRDCVQDSTKNYIEGDVITVYGEGAGNVTVYDEFYEPHSAPCINVAYVAD